MADLSPRAAAGGAIVQFGGQTPLKLAHSLEAAGVNILGTSPEAIDLAEDRRALRRSARGRASAPGPERLRRVDLADEAAAWRTRSATRCSCDRAYVLGGRAMSICLRPDPRCDSGLHAPGGRTSRPAPGASRQASSRTPSRSMSTLVSPTASALWSRGIMQHIEEAGIHSGDSAAVLPPYRVSEPDLDRMRDIAVATQAGAADGCRRPDERAVRHLRRRGVRAGSQPEGLAYGALHRQGGRPAPGTDRDPGHGRRDSRRDRPHCRTAGRPVLRQGARLPLRPFPRRRPGARPGDEVDRRGDGHRAFVRQRLRQGVAGRRPCAAGQRSGVPFGPRPGQEGAAQGGGAAAGSRLRTVVHCRYRRLPRRARDRDAAGEQARGGPPRTLWIT